MRFAAVFAAEFHHRADMLFGGNDGGFNEWLGNFINLSRVGPVTGVVDFDFFAGVERDFVFNRGCGDDKP